MFETTELENAKNRDVTVPEDVGDMIASGAQVLQLRTQHQMQVSLQRPREFHNIEKRAKEEAAIMGEMLYYQWSVKDKNGRASVISGISINGAMMLARLWGNCAVTIDNVEPAPDGEKIYATFLDFETNYQVTRAFKINRSFIVYGRMDQARKEDIRFQIGQSKALRNVILAAMPAWLKQKAFDAALAGVRTKIERYIQKNGIQAARDFATKQLEKYGIDEARICEKFSIKKSAALDVDALVIIAGDLAALQDGAEDAQTLYPEIKSEQDEKGTAITERLKQKMEAAGKPKKVTPPKSASAKQDDAAEPKEQAFIDDWVDQPFEGLYQLYMDLRQKSPVKLKEFYIVQRAKDETLPEKAPENFKELFDLSSRLAARLVYRMSQHADSKK